MSISLSTYNHKKHEERFVTGKGARLNDIVNQPVKVDLRLFTSNLVPVFTHCCSKVWGQ